MPCWSTAPHGDVHTSNVAPTNADLRADCHPQPFLRPRIPTRYSASASALVGTLSHALDWARAVRLTPARCGSSPRVCQNPTGTGAGAGCSQCRVLTAAASVARPGAVCAWYATQAPWGAFPHRLRCAPRLCTGKAELERDDRPYFHRPYRSRRPPPLTLAHSHCKSHRRPRRPSCDAFCCGDGAREAPLFVSNSSI